MPNVGQSNQILGANQVGPDVILTGNIKDGEIKNADISASAAIVYSKLALALSILNADISASAAIAYSKLALGNSIVNADIASNAAIDVSKLTGVANSGANSTITSLTGLSTPLTVAQGGSGVATHTANLLRVGNGASVPNEVAIGTSGQALLSNGAGADPSFQTISQAFYAVPSGTLQTSADNDDTGPNSASYSIIKRIQVLLPGIMTVVFDLKGNFANTNAKGRIYINGVAIGTIRSGTADTLWVTQPTENIRVNAGDYIELWVAGEGSGTLPEVRNFRLSYTKTVITGDNVITN